MRTELVEEFRRVGFEAIVRRESALALNVISDFRDCYNARTAGHFSGSEVAADATLDMIRGNYRFLEKLQDSVNREASLTTSQQRLLTDVLLEMMRPGYRGSPEAERLLQLVAFVNSCRA